uniref:Growth-regulating factor n=1 Tax=Kalanchoe fedtschenkoi TaxID=63787 RepID=A0A7N0ZT92_KALFE
MLRSSSSASASPFTVSQWQELEHQALIYKYLMAGLAIPPDLVLPIQKSFEAVSSRFFTHPTMGYCSFYGKKIDPEPGRCRRTDGKKWRCSKDAYPDSKYCERHMHRGRNRSRKPVESPQPVSQLASSTVTSLNVNAGGAGAGNATVFPSLPLQAFGGGMQSGSLSSGTNHQSHHFNEDHIPYGIPSKDYRYVHGLKPETGEHNFFGDASGSNRSLQIENAWSMLPSQVSAFTSSKPSSNSSSLLQSDYTQNPLFSPDFASSDSAKQGNSLRPFFDEWPKARDSWSGLEEERSNPGSYSTTHLSMSIPMGSSDFSATSSQSPNEN